jgi:hypothetical protein
VRLRRDRPGAGNAGLKVMALIYAMALGADYVDNCDVLRAGRSRRLCGRLAAGTFDPGHVLAHVTFGDVRQLDRVLGEALARAWKAGAGPADGRLTVDVDSFVGEPWGHAKQGASAHVALHRSRPGRCARRDLRAVDEGDDAAAAQGS